MTSLTETLDVILNTPPSYILGRFQTVRAGYSAARRAQQAIAGIPTLMLGDIFDPPSVTLSPAASEVLISRRSAAEHVLDLKRLAWSGGIELTREAFGNLVAIAKQARLITNSSPRYIHYQDVIAVPELRNSIALGTVCDSCREPVIQNIAAHPAIVEPIREYLGYSPGEVSSRLFWSFANRLTSKEREAQYQTIRFHYDVHGYNFIYVNFYLTQADSESGAHVLIEGTHRRKTFSQLLGTVRMDDETAAQLFGTKRVKVMDGPAGSGFFEDTACYHKALPPASHDRLMLQLRYQ